MNTERDRGERERKKVRESEVGKEGKKDGKKESEREKNKEKE